MEFEPGATDITLPDNMKEIYEEAFKGCTSLETINVSPSFSYLNKSDLSNTKWYKDQTDLAILSAVLIAYKGDAAEVTIPNGVKIIGVGAFEGCTSLTSITIPDSVTEIYGSAFSGCTSLASITIPDSVTEIDRYVFKDCTSLTSVTIPDSVTKVSRGVFVAARA